MQQEIPAYAATESTRMKKLTIPELALGVLIWLEIHNNLFKFTIREILYR